MPPKPPLGHHPVPPHERKLFGIFTARSLLFALIIGSIITLIVGLVLNYFKIPLEVILPVLAPILVGSITLAYSVLNQMH